jgi:hypothetical protein
MKSAAFELSFVDSRFAHIVAIALLGSVDVISFIVGAVLELFLAKAMNDIILPLTTVLIILEWVNVDPSSTGDVIIDLSLINTPVVEYVTTLSLSNAISKGALVVRSIFEEKLTISMKLIVGPLTVVVSFGTTYLFVCLAIDAFGKESAVFRAVGSHLVHLFANHCGEYVLGHFLGDHLVDSDSFSGGVLCVSLKLFMPAAVILLAHSAFPFE